MKSFEFLTDDGGILKIDDEVTVNTWTNPDGEPKGKYPMKRNHKYDFNAMHYERGGRASSQSILRWAKLTPEKSPTTLKPGKNMIAEKNYETVTRVFITISLKLKENSSTGKQMVVIK